MFVSVPFLNVQGAQVQKWFQGYLLCCSTLYVPISRYITASVGHYYSVFFIQVTVAPRISKTHSHNLEDGNQQKLPKNGSNRTIFRKSYHLWNLFLQSIVESPTGQLKLGEIYSWFSNNFKHFRTTCNLTWKVILRSYLTFFVCQPFSSSVSSNLWTFSSYLPVYRVNLKAKTPNTYFNFI